MRFSDLDQDSITNILDFIEVEFSWQHFFNPCKSFYGFFPNTKRVPGNHALIFKNIHLNETYRDLKYLPANITGLRVQSEHSWENRELYMHQVSRFSKLLHLGSPIQVNQNITNVKFPEKLKYLSFTPPTYEECSQVWDQIQQLTHLRELHVHSYLPLDVKFPQSLKKLEITRIETELNCVNIEELTVAEIDILDRLKGCTMLNTLRIGKKYTIKFGGIPLENITLSTFVNLKHLEVPIEMIDSETISSLSKLSKLQSLIIRISSNITENIYKNLSSLSELKNVKFGLRICRIESLIDQNFINLGKTLALISLQFYDCHIDDFDVELISDISTLEKIVFENNYVTSGCLQKLAKIQNIKEIQIDPNIVNLEDILKIIADHPQLKIVVLNGSGSVDEAFTWFIELCKDKSRNELIVPKTFSPTVEEVANMISHFQNLKRLHLMGSITSSSNMETLLKRKEWSQIEMLHINSNVKFPHQQRIWNKLIPLFKSLKELQIVNYYTSRSAENFEYVTALKNLETLYIRNSISPSDLVNLSKCTSLKNIYMECVLSEKHIEGLVYLGLKNISLHFSQHHYLQSQNKPFKNLYKSMIFPTVENLNNVFKDIKDLDSIHTHILKLYADAVLKNTKLSEIELAKISTGNVRADFILNNSLVWKLIPIKYPNVIVEKQHVKPQSALHPFIEKWLINEKERKKHEKLSLNLIEHDIKYEDLKPIWNMKFENFSLRFTNFSTEQIKHFANTFNCENLETTEAFFETIKIIMCEAKNIKNFIIDTIEFPMNRLVELSKLKSRCSIKFNNEVHNQIFMKANELKIESPSILNEMNDSLDFVTTVNIIKERHSFIVNETWINLYKEILHLRKFPNLKKVILPTSYASFTVLKALHRMKSVDYLEWSAPVYGSVSWKPLLAKYNNLTITELDESRIPSNTILISSKNETIHSGLMFRMIGFVSKSL